MKQNKVCTNLAQDFTDAEKAQGRSNIGAVSASEVSTAISNAVGQLDVSDNVTTNQFVTSVSESDGRVSVTRRQPVIADVQGLEDELSRITPQVQSDWTEADENLPSFVKHKPENLVQDADYHHTDNNFTDAEKTKLSGIATGAEVNQNAFSNVRVGNTTIQANSKTGTLELVAGSNIILTPDEVYDKITIVATDTKYTAGSNIQIDSNNVISATDTKYTAGSGLTLSGTQFSNAAPNVKSDWNAAAGSSAEILNKPSVPSIKTTSTSLPPVDTNVSNMTLFTDGRVTVNNSTDVGLLAPIGSQSDAGKVLTGTYSGSPGKFTASWAAVQAPLSAGNGITISNNVVSAKVKSGGGISVDPSEGLYVPKVEVTLTLTNGVVTSDKTYQQLFLYIYNGYFVDAKLIRGSDRYTLLSRNVSVNGTASFGSIEFTFFETTGNIGYTVFEGVYRVVVSSSGTISYRNEVLAPQPPYFTYNYVNGAWEFKTWQNREECTLQEFLNVCNNTSPGASGRGLFPFGLIHYADSSNVYMPLSYGYFTSGEYHYMFTTTYHDVLASPVKNMLVTAIIDSDGIATNAFEV